MTQPTEMLSVSQALSRVTSGFRVIESEHISLSNAHGRVLAEDLKARLSQPPVSVSSMDGFAVRAADVQNIPAQLTQVGISRAGNGYKKVVGPGECARIFTGAPLPDGTNAVVIQEVTARNRDQIEVQKSVSEGANVRGAGLDFRSGELIIRAGKRLTARDVGLAASMNFPWLRVRRQPRIALIANGDEIVMPGEPLLSDQIISSNSLALEAYIRELGGIVVNLGIARDTEKSLREALMGARGSDALVTIGGASVGDYDLVRGVMAAEGNHLNFYKVAMRPGKPLIFGTWREIPVLGLPGNPVSAGVTSFIFLRAAMEIMLGTGDGSMKTENAWLGRDLPGNGDRQDFMRSELSINGEGRLVATPFSVQDSSMMTLFAKADCLALRAPFAPPASRGDPISILRLDTFI